MLNIEKYKEEIVQRYVANAYIDENNNDCPAKNVGLAFIQIFTEVTGEPKCINDLLDWFLSEYKEPILDDKEKEYLGNVIKPFKDKVIYICKASIGDSLYQIEIYYKEEDGDKDVIALPSFNAGLMYKGMKMDSYYDLKELGLC